MLKRILENCSGKLIEGIKSNMQIGYNEFTEDSYRAIVKQAASKYLFVNYGYKGSELHAIWRHDVDFSLNRALKLAQIEAELGVTSTWFILLRSEYYNPLEIDASSVLKKILGLGHKIGLHIDLAAYPEVVTDGQLTAAIQFEAGILEKEFDISISEFAFHNPNPRNESFSSYRIGEYVNASASYFRTEYTYASDSNGYWRFKSIPTVIQEGTGQNLCILTHPVWWTPSAQSPFERVKRAITGRALYAENYYCNLLKQYGRINIGHESKSYKLQIK